MLSNHELPYVGRFACDWLRLATTDPHAAHPIEVYALVLVTIQVPGAGFTQLLLRPSLNGNTRASGRQTPRRRAKALFSSSDASSDRADRRMSGAHRHTHPGPWAEVRP